MEMNDKQEKRRNTFAILFYINRTQVRKDGTCKVFCNISINGLSELIGTKIYVKPTLWIAGGGRASGRSQNALRVNELIDKLEVEIRNHYHNIKESLGFVTAELIKNAVQGVAQKQVTLMKLFEEHNEEFKKRVGVDRGKEAYKLYEVSYNHLLAFIRKHYDADDITLRSLDLKFYDAYELFLRTDRGLQQKTVHQHLYNFKKITKRAFNQGTLRRDPYMKLFPKLPPLKSRHLKLEELERLMAYEPDKPNLCRARDMFIFSTFTGLCHADLKRLSDEHIKEAEDGSLWIHIKRQKTGTECNVRLMEIPLRIIEKYRPEKKDEHIFKVYRRDYMGRLLRKVAQKCGIEYITFHKARHNFGTHITLSQGVPIETVSRMMGHKNISTTQIYAKVTDMKVAEDMKKLNERPVAKDVSLYEDESLRKEIRFPGIKRQKKNVQSSNNE